MSMAPAVNRWPRRVVLGLVGIAVAFTALSGPIVDYLWFDEVGFRSVFLTTLRTRFLLGAAFGVAFFAVLYANVLIARRLAPPVRPAFGFDPIARYRAALDAVARWLLPLAAAAVALVVGLGASTEWRTFLLWRSGSGVPFGTVDPLFSRDIGYYVFTLPWLRFVQSWLYSALVGVLVLTAVAHLVWGGIRPEAPGLDEKVTPQCKAHLSVLLGLVVLVKAWGYVLGQYALVTSRRGVVTGASFTDIEAQLPALRLLAIVAVVCAVLFLVNIRLRGWALPALSVALLAFVAVVAGAAYPAFVQRFRVAPQELQRERPYIERNIEATRDAFGLTAIDVADRTVGDAVTTEEAQADATVLANIRVWRPDVLQDSLKSLQRIKQYYEFADVDVDRYVIGGQRRVVMLSAREISQAGIPGGGGTWQNRHLVFTHGFGAVASSVNTATPEGAPVFTLKDIPPVGQPALTGDGQRIYFGEFSDVPFVVVRSGAKELDYQGIPGDDQAQATTTYEGSGGIPVGGLASRALFAWRYRDVNLLISSLIRPESRIIIRRAIAERVPRIAPFLTYDADPYAAIVDGRLVWIWDAYTTTDAYPYAQHVDLQDVTTPSIVGPSPVGTVNYIRNPVKAVVDAYDGSVTLYLVDETDPIALAWSRAFPHLFTPGSEASEDLRAHFRYPENLFQVQAAQYGVYHVTDPTVFYGNQDAWQIAADPTRATQFGLTPMRPYYLLLRLPGETQEGFVLVIPFTPQGRQNLVSWMVARSDPGSGYGEIVAYQFPSGQNVDGPEQVFARINQDPRFSTERTLLGQGGSSVEFGDFLVIPVGQSLLYVQPVYVSSAANAIPELKRVLVVNGGEIGIGTTLQAALGAPHPPSALGRTPGELHGLRDRRLRLPDLGLVGREVAGAQRHLGGVEVADGLLQQRADAF
ncbi:MAG: UPF0182 family protein, partial [Actinomycetota bacterium]